MASNMINDRACASVSLVASGAAARCAGWAQKTGANFGRLEAFLTGPGDCATFHVAQTYTKG